MKTRTPLLSFASLLCALLGLTSQASAQDLDFKQQIEAGRYEDLADKLEANLDLAKADAKLRAYLQFNIDYLRRGARPRVPGSEVILVRGARNDSLYQMPNASGRKRADGHALLWSDSYPSGGPRLMLPNRIRHLRSAWDKRLPYFDRYFEEATDLLGGSGADLRELDKIIGHHKGGGLGTSANSVKSVLISTSTRPLSNFGPPYYIVKTAPERCIFNYEGLSNEFEVLLPFWILPHEIVARCETLDEVLNHPLYQQSQLKELEFRGDDWSGPSNWTKLEQNVREGRLPLPLDQDADAGSLTGTVERSGSKVYLKVGAERLLIKPAAVATELKTFAGQAIEVRLKGDVSGSNLSVSEVVSPVYREDQRGRVSSQGLVDAGGNTLEIYGPFAKTALSETLSYDGYLFSDAAGRPRAVYPRRARATLAQAVRLSRPLSHTYPAGTEVEISYLSSTGRSALIRTADGGWGYVASSKLQIGAAKTGIIDALSMAGN